jgi:3-oxoadipate enol-lactonase/4-carboxymuconolactone decarboxylase
MRGHGLTSCTPGPYTIEGLADDLFETLAVLGVKTAHIGGVSIGGLIAQAFALAHPEAVASLILVDTALSIPPAQPWLDRAALVRDCRDCGCGDRPLGDAGIYGRARDVWPAGDADAHAR